MRDIPGETPAREIRVSGVGSSACARSGDCSFFDRASRGALIHSACRVHVVRKVRAERPSPRPTAPSSEGQVMVSSRLQDRLLVLLVSGTLVILAILALVYPFAPTVRAQNIREFFLAAQPASIDVSPGVTWNAWTYNGTVPGRTPRVRVGDLPRVHFPNNRALQHSIHVHGLRYTIENDGSQAYPASMPGPGESYTYTYEATRPGLFYYHCHSSDGNRTISYHIQQGLYGAIIVYPADEWPPTTTYEFVTFFGEAPGIGYHINGKQAWEGDLHELVETQGYDGAFQTLKG